MTKKAFITGITGQDGSYLAELLLSKGYEVHGLIRRSSTSNTKNIEQILDRIKLHEGDMTDSGCLARIVDEVIPDEVYNLAAQSHVHTSFSCPEYTVDVTGAGCLRLLEAIRAAQERHHKVIRFYQASSSEMFGSNPPPQTIDTPFHPRSPYGVAKCYAYWQTVNHREAYDIFACNGILFNHTGCRRNVEFVTRKITKAVARIVYGLQRELRLGNLDARRDFGSAKDYVEAMYLMLQQDKPGDYIVATGESYSIKEVCNIAFSYLDLNYRDYVIVDPKFYRPAEVNYLLGNPEETFNKIGWKPKTTFKKLIREMVNNDLREEEQNLCK